MNYLLCKKKFEKMLSLLLAVGILLIPLSACIFDSPAFAEEIANNYSVKFSDDFNRSNGSIENDWIAGSNAVATIDNNAVLLHRNTPSRGTEYKSAYVTESALVRPQSEATLNQEVSAEFIVSESVRKSNIGGALIARCQDTTATNSNCYRMYARLGYDGADNSASDIVLYNSKNELLYSSKAKNTSPGIYSDSHYKLLLRVESVNQITSKLTMELYLISNDNEESLQFSQTVYDADSNLQKAGTVGFSMYEYYGLNMKIDNFTYKSKEVDYKELNDSYIFEDDFNRTDGDIHNDNGWTSPFVTTGSYTSQQISDNTLIIEDQGTGGGWSLARRPDSEKAINQKVSVDIVNIGALSNNSSANVLLRQNPGASVSQYTCYVAVVTNQSLSIKYYDGNWHIYALDNGGLASNYTINYSHKYRVEFSAQGVSPTLLKATLFDVTAGNICVTSVNGSDSKASMQKAGVSGLAMTKNGAGQNTAIYDNFKYSITDKTVFADDFNREDGAVANSWSKGDGSNATISSNKVVLERTSPSRGTVDNTGSITQLSMVRPLSEMSLNQTVSAEFKCNELDKQDQGGVLIARCQGDKAASNNCYRFVVRMGYNGNSTQTGMYLYNTTGTAIWSADSARYMSRDERYRLEMSVESVSATKTQITISLFRIDSDGNIIADTAGNIKNLDHKVLTDEDPNLQKPGTAGFAEFTVYGHKMEVDNFKYVSSDVVESNDIDAVYNTVEAESKYFYKHGFNKVYQSGTLEGYVVAEKDNINHISYDNLLNDNLNDTGYIAFSVNAPQAGKYLFRTRFAISSNDSSAYNNYCTDNGNPYATFVVNGNTKYQIAYSSIEPNVNITTGTIEIDLLQGDNTIIATALSSEITNVISDASIAYDTFFIPSDLKLDVGSYNVIGDANNDENVNIIDLVLVKKYLAHVTNNINTLAADVTFVEGTKAIDANDITGLCNILLGIENDSIKFNKYALVDNIDTTSVMPEVVGFANEEANSIKSKVTNSQDSLTISGTTYYLSNKGSDENDGLSAENAWKTLDKLRTFDGLKSGDAVLFERGSVFRQDNINRANAYGISAVQGVSYGAYGTGAKPVISGSPLNYADSIWTDCGNNIWSISTPVNDAGIIVFDNGKAVGIKQKNQSDLTKVHDFYCDDDNNIIYLYSLVSPNVNYYDIEIGFDRPVIAINDGVDNVVIDNLDIRYSGAHAIDASKNNDYISITNCEVSWVGGSWQTQNEVRYGNGIQFWDDCSNITIDNCVIKQCYDAGLTFQGAKNTQVDSIEFTNNLIQYCNYSIEFFIQKDINDAVTIGEIDNINIDGNVMQYCGYGFCEQRPNNSGEPCHICGWSTDVAENLTNFNITNNIFDLSNGNIVIWNWNATEELTVSGNTYYKANNKVLNYGNLGQKNANSQQTLEEAISVFDSNPDYIAWITK